ncbi:MAG: large subunit ribosomal protein [Chloroflexota bacterium]|jgi:large subunit ribosomal protein L25|nr:large subunit ribosomal protein [Chloroflexota bacterium]
MPTATSSRLNLAAEPRELTGKKVAILRRDGRLPAVVFGHGLGSENVSVDAHEFDLLRRKAGQNALIDLSVDGKKARPVLVHGVQVHPVNRRPLHVDLFLVRMTEELTVDVPLVAIGTSHAVENLNGTLMHQLDSVRIRALPDHLPQAIEYSIESLVDFDVAIHVSDLTIPGDVTLLTDPEEVVAKVLASRLQAEEAALEAEEATAAEAVEGEAAPEGAEAAPADGTAAGGGASGDSSEG